VIAHGFQVAQRVRVTVTSASGVRRRAIAGLSPATRVSRRVTARRPAPSAGDGVRADADPQRVRAGAGTEGLAVDADGDAGLIAAHFQRADLLREQALVGGRLGEDLGAEGIGAVDQRALEVVEGLEGTIEAISARTMLKRMAG
jgi:hypothetical protein